MKFTNEHDQHPAIQPNSSWSKAYENALLNSCIPVFSWSKKKFMSMDFNNFFSVCFMNRQLKLCLSSLFCYTECLEGKIILLIYVSRHSCIVSSWAGYFLSPFDRILAPYTVIEAAVYNVYYKCNPGSEEKNRMYVNRT